MAYLKTPTKNNQEEENTSIGAGSLGAVGKSPTNKPTGSGMPYTSLSDYLGANKEKIGGNLGRVKEGVESANKNAQDAITGLASGTSPYANIGDIYSQYDRTISNLRDNKPINQSALTSGENKLESALVSSDANYTSNLKDYLSGKSSETLNPYATNISSQRYNTLMSGAAKPRGMTKQEADAENARLFKMYSGDDNIPSWAKGVNTTERTTFGEYDENTKNQIQALNRAFGTNYAIGENYTTYDPMTESQISDIYDKYRPDIEPKTTTGTGISDSYLQESMANREPYRPPTITGTTTPPTYPNPTTNVNKPSNQASRPSSNQGFTLEQIRKQIEDLFK